MKIEGKGHVNGGNGYITKRLRWTFQLVGGRNAGKRGPYIVKRERLKTVMRP